MDKKEKRAKKDAIRGKIPLGNGRFKDFEVDKLMDMVSHPDKYDGKQKRVRDSGKGTSSDGPYRWQEETVYTIRNDDAGMRIEEHYSYRDDDGGKQDFTHDHKTGREILNLYYELFG